MKTQERRDLDKASGLHGPDGGVAGKRAPTDGLAAGAASAGAAVPLLQFKPGAGTKAPSSDESYLDSILGTDEDQLHAKGANAKGRHSVERVTDKCQLWCPRYDPGSGANQSDLIRTCHTLAKPYNRYRGYAQSDWFEK
jgi:hypothetical protein